MTRENFIELFPQKHPKWREHYLVDANALMKSVILATSQLSWPLKEGRGCREFWYNPIKPILFKAIGERAENYGVVFEKLLSKMVKAGVVTYASLGILDFRTMREIFEANEQAQCWKNILLFVEKDSAYVHLTPLQNLFNINIMSGHGWSNTSGIERILRDLVNKGVSEVVIFTLTDYDPFGFAIDQEFVDKCESLGLYVSEHYRIGINVEHATPEILDVQKYPIKLGRRLSVNGVSFDSNRWLAKYGIDRRYGLEIEAISAQLNGHLQLRIIVAKELLKYLKETDRVEEITKPAWENAPLKAIAELMYQIDNSWPEPNEILQPPKELPTQYLTYAEYVKGYTPIKNSMDSETEGITEEITDLQDQLEELEFDRSKIEEPYREQLREIASNYVLSRHILSYCLHQYYQQNKEKWQRENYSLGYPKGCLVTAVEQQQDLATFIKQVDATEIIKDIQSVLKDAMSNGEIQRLILDTLNGRGETNE